MSTQPLTSPFSLKDHNLCGRSSQKSLRYIPSRISQKEISITKLLLMILLIMTTMHQSVSESTSKLSLCYIQGTNPSKIYAWGEQGWRSGGPWPPRNQTEESEYLWAPPPRIFEEMNKIFQNFKHFSRKSCGSSRL
jgi:hypothetical protein